MKWQGEEEAKLLYYTVHRLSGIGAMTENQDEMTKKKKKGCKENRKLNSKNRRDLFFFENKLKSN